MNQAKWKRNFETGNELIDSQHKLLFGKIQDCIDASRNNLPRPELIAQLQDIQNFLSQHFMEEEKLMREMRNSSSTHMAQHSHISQLLEQQISTLSLNDEKEKLSIQHVLFSLYDWYVNHLQAEDTSFHNSPQLRNN